MSCPHRMQKAHALARGTIAALGLLLAWMTTAHAQTSSTYDLSWNTVDNGGATFSTSASYSLGGTIGQHDAGLHTSASYRLRGGFWAFEPDCNRNGTPDDLDIANCTGEPACSDCNGNGIPDECDIASCPPSDPSCHDCNANGVPDECDIANCAPGDVSCADCNHNGAIDLCDGIGGAPLPEAPVTTKNRYLSFRWSGAGGTSAIRVTLSSLHHPNPPNLPQFPAPSFGAVECGVRWIGPPSNCQESEVQHTTFKCATLQCAPAYVNWEAALGGATLHVAGAEVVPSSVYLVQSLSSGADVLDENAYSVPLVIPTARWGDIVAPFQQPSPALLSQPNISDIAAIVDKFKDLPGAVIKARAQLRGETPNPASPVDIRDVASDVDAFKGFAYPFTVPPSCP